MSDKTYMLSSTHHTTAGLHTSYCERFLLGDVPRNFQAETDHTAHCPSDHVYI
jgi:hypothetical protein